MTDWISVKDRLPEAKQRVLFIAKSVHREMIGTYSHTGERGVVWFRSGYQNKSYTASHWMPLPEPPKEG